MVFIHLIPIKHFLHSNAVIYMMYYGLLNGCVVPFLTQERPDTCAFTGSPATVLSLYP